MKLKILAVCAALALGVFYYTHTKEYVTVGYEKTMEKACEGSATCELGTILLEEDTVICLQGKLFSTSEQSTYDCLKQVLNERNKK